MNETREKMNYDVVIVGAGPSGLSAGIKIKKLALKNTRSPNGHTAHDQLSEIGRG